MPAARPADAPGASPQPAAETRQPDPPPWFVAAQDLYVGGHAGTMPARAFTAGDRVPPDLVDAHGWAHLVTHPDD